MSREDQRRKEGGGGQADIKSINPHLTGVIICYNHFFRGWPILSRNLLLILVVLPILTFKCGFSLFLAFFTPKTNAEITGTNAEIRGTNAEIPGMDF